VLRSKGVGRKIFRENGAKKTPRPRNSTNKPHFISGRLEGALGMHPGLHLKGTLDQEPHRKTEDHFYGEIPISGKMSIF